ncbi:uncharacterized protein MONBRDRAFT_23840 [Monosiga brevicollis MX1]|uniref:SprT-like domain-containing protein n=1 Tax=Monosiga brevicollis TaxID=81824 RepID=A9UUZ8_MONBE|nr:uncharacterized protein MONBRDRAFT_23840 [Monosiga brevicollis MX1]EDQ90998.1 predicted protein [Monosiga brevicollis MX1]|eukprot:XP_001744295.1 hypothetical protein [Monosiga brevicollis MX1]
MAGNMAAWPQAARMYGWDQFGSLQAAIEASHHLASATIATRLNGSVSDAEDDLPFVTRRRRPRSGAKPARAVLLSDSDGDDDDGQEGPLSDQEAIEAQSPGAASPTPSSEGSGVSLADSELRSGDEVSDDDWDRDLSDFIVDDDDGDEDESEDDDEEEAQDSDNVTEDDAAEDNDGMGAEDTDENLEDGPGYASPPSSVPSPWKGENLRGMTPRTPRRRHRESVQQERSPLRPLCEAPTGQFYEFDTGSTSRTPCTPTTPTVSRSNAKTNKSKVAFRQSQSMFRRSREHLASQLFQEYNVQVFDRQLPQDLELKWSNRLNTTAGRAVLRLQRATGHRTASIELSTKVVDSKEKLENTLCHELCHVAAWLINGVNKPPHGRVFKGWAARAMRRYRHLNITTCHSYEIEFRYRYQCTNAECGHVFGRHSKSINVDRQVCGRCHSRLILQPQLKADGTPRKKRAPTAFSLFVKENFGAVKQAEPGLEHAAIMRTLAAQFKAQTLN